jgi:hypothetical protein
MTPAPNLLSTGGFLRYAESPGNRCNRYGRIADFKLIGRYQARLLLSTFSVAIMSIEHLGQFGSTQIRAFAAPRLFE